MSLVMWYNLLGVRVGMYMVLLLYMVFFNVVECAKTGKNNVCTTFSSYGNIENDKRCFYNPDMDSTPINIASRYGYTLETYLVTTEDNYIVSIFRLKKKNTVKEFGQPVILQHGITVDGVSWILSGNNSLGFILNSDGYDVWLPNFRGTKYSRKHQNLTISEKDYWDFSFHEMGVYDLPAIIEKIAEETKRTDLVFISHSMGATSALVYAALKPEHANKHIKAFLHLAPVAFFNNANGALKLGIMFYELIKSFFESLNIYAIGTDSLLQTILARITYGSYPLTLTTQIVYSFATGLAVDQIRPEMLPVVLKFYPTGTAIKTLIHFVQIHMANGRFQWFDYGETGNLQKYNSVLPPIYDIKKIEIPIHLFASKSDFISVLQDTRALYNHLECPKELHVYDLGHTDYLYGKNTRHLYKDIINVTRQFY